MSATGGGRAGRSARAVAIVVAILGAAAPAAHAALPDGRAYEMVSPPNKLGTDAVFSLASFGSDDGNRYIWTTATPVADSVNGAQNQYEATRTASGWTSHAVGLPLDAYRPLTVVNAFTEFACDGCSSVVGSVLESADPRDADDDRLLINGVDVYVSDGPGHYSFLSGGSIGGAAHANANYGGRSSDGRHLTFSLNEAIEPEASGVDPGAAIAYDHVGGQTVIVGRNDDGSVMTGGSVIGSGLTNAAATAQIGARGGQLHAVSADGSRIFFESPDPAMTRNPHLYLRQDGAHTVEVSAPQCSGAGCDTGAVEEFEGASTDGSRVFFTSFDRLVDDDTNSSLDLYEYDVASHALIRISGGDDGTGDPDLALGAIGFSDDGSRAYFVAQGVLTSAPNPHGDTAQPGEANIYAYERDAAHPAGHTSFVATTPDSTSISSGSGLESQRTSRVTPDGKHLIFADGNDLLGTAAGAAQVYKYDADEPALTCISCPSSGTSTGDATLLLGQSYARTPSHNVSDDGRIVFFQTSTPLVPEDTNGLGDVYEWHDGVVALISSGADDKESRFLDATPSGSDVYFATFEPLVGSDDDLAADVYDARVGGGFPELQDADACSDDGCQGAATPPPAAPVVASLAFSGPGNLPVLPPSVATRSQPISVAKAKVVTGTAAGLRVKVPGAGRITASGASLRTVRRTTARATTYTVKVALTATARKQLAKHRKLAVRVKVAFAPVTGASSSKTITLNFKQSKKGAR